MKRVSLILFSLLFVLGVVDTATAVNLYASDVTSDGVKLTWTEYPSIGFARYEIYLDDGNGWRLLETIQDQDTTEYRVTGLEAGKPYYLKIETHYFDYNTFEYESEESNIVDVMTWERGFNWSLVILAVLLLVIGVAIGVLVAQKKK